MATLLAGFAFTAFAAMNGDGFFDLKTFFFLSDTGAYSVTGQAGSVDVELNGTTTAAGDVDLTVDPERATSFGVMRIVRFVMEAFEQPITVVHLQSTARRGGAGGGGG